MNSDAIKVDRTDRTSTGPSGRSGQPKARSWVDGNVHFSAHSIPTHGGKNPFKNRPDDRTKSLKGSGRLFGCFGQVLQYYFLWWGLEHD